MANSIQYSSPAPLHFISGMLLAFVSATSVLVSLGQCQNDTSTALLTLRASVTLNLATLGAGGIDTGGLAQDHFYYVYVIAGADVGVSAIASRSAAQPLLPTGYTTYRRVGSFRTKTAAAEVIAFTTTGSGRDRRTDFQELDAGANLVASNAGGSFSCAAWLPAGATRLLAYLELVGQLVGPSVLTVAQPTLTGIYALGTDGGTGPAAAANPIAIQNQVQLTTNAALNLAYTVTGVDADTIAIINAQGYQEIV